MAHILVSEFVFLFKQKTAYEMRISDWSSDVCSSDLLVAMGAHIDGIGTETLTIEGVDRLHGATYRVMADRIEAGSYACAAVITEGDVELGIGRASCRERVCQYV